VLPEAGDEPVAQIDKVGRSGGECLGFGAEKKLDVIVEDALHGLWRTLQGCSAVEQFANEEIVFEHFDLELENVVPQLARRLLKSA
jgi:hypothetical protein